jgi:hypothetical protein
LAANDQTIYFSRELNPKYNLIRGWPGDRGKYRRLTADSGTYTHILINLANKCNLKILKVMAMKEKANVRTKIMINNNII